MRLVPFLALVLPLFPISLRAAESPRVFVTDSNSWQISGGFTASEGRAAGAVTGGARPQTAEIMKTFRERCPDVVVTMNNENADFVILLDHEGGKGYSRRDNKVAVFRKDGDMIYSGSTRMLGNAVKDACNAIASAPVPTALGATVAKEQASQPVPLAPSQTGVVSRANEATQPATAAVVPEPTPEPAPATAAPISQQAEPATVVIKSTPEGAEITVDGKFVGSTPSTLQLPPGDHEIIVEKKGGNVRRIAGGDVTVPAYRAWRRTLTANPGSTITVDAALEKID